MPSKCFRSWSKRPKSSTPSVDIAYIGYAVAVDNEPRRNFTTGKQGMEKVELTLLRLTYSHTNAGAYALILAEVGGDRRLPIIIGGVEAQAIAIKLENIRPARPLTHDLFKNLCSQLDITLREVVINDLVEGIFHAKLILEQDGKTVEVDTRTSDAIALSLRFNCPIYTYEFILAAAGLRMDESSEEGEHQLLPTEPKEEKDLHQATAEELQAMLASALESEDYEGASKLRDELNRRKGTN